MSPLTSRIRGKYGRFIAEIGKVTEVLIFNLVFWLTLKIQPVPSDEHSRVIWIMLNLTFIIVLFWIGRKGYNRSITIERALTLTFKEVMLHAMVFIPTLYFLRLLDFTVWELVFFYTLALLGLCLFHILLNLTLRFMRRRGYNSSNVVIVGGGPQTERLYRQMAGRNIYGYCVMGLFGPKPLMGESTADIWKGGIEKLHEFMQENKVDEVYYCSDKPGPREIALVAQECEAQLIQFFFVPQIPPQVLGRFTVSSLGSIPVLTLKEAPLKSCIYSWLKRGFDLLFSGTVLLFSPIIFIPVAIGIKLSSPGPVFFKQKRTGLKGRAFYCYKFRTMKVNADSDNVQATRDDPRKTRFGNFLRRTSIDELPQFINVFIGDMSIVGPRPHMLKHTEEYSQLIKQYMVRHAVKPGITGWAQVNGYRGETKELWQMAGRVEHDIWYIEHWSFLLDMKIMVKTIVNAIRGESNAF